jgi:hypothetical protein
MGILPAGRELLLFTSGLSQMFERGCLGSEDFCCFSLLSTKKAVYLTKLSRF